MKATVPWLGALLLAGAAVPALHAQPYPVPCPPAHVGCHPPYCAPDACGPGYYCQHPCGAVYGPNYCLRPPWEPFNGFTPCLGKPGPQVGQGLPGPPVYLGPRPAPGLPSSPLFPTHPYARSPRDYFME
jgi:hypothetical protein